MKKLFKSIIAVCVIVGMICSTSAFALYGLSDGGTNAEEESDGLKLIDFNSETSVKDSGFMTSTEHTTDGQYSAWWNHNVKGAVDVRNLPTSDWSDYNELTLSMYAENAEDTKFVLVFMCGADVTAGYYYTTLTVKDGQHDYTLKLENIGTGRAGCDWGRISYVRFSGNGWGMTINPEGNYYINGFKLYKLGDGVEKYYSKEDTSKTYAALEGNAAVYAGGRKVVSGKNIDDYKDIVWKNDITYIPADLFKDYLNAEVATDGGKATILANGAKIELTADSTAYTRGSKTGNLSYAPYTAEDGTFYVPGAEVAKILGYQIKADDKLLIMGDSKVRNFDSNETISNMSEIAAYMAYNEPVDFDSITADDYQAIIDNWKYELVADDTIDLEDEAIAKYVKNISSTGKGRWDTMKKYKTSTDSLFLGKKAVESADMGTEYGYVRDMAKAWAQYGSEYYHNEELLEDIKFALEWLYEYRYGQDEIENNSNAWRDHTAYNWFEWQITAPWALVDTMMLLDDELTEEQVDKYLAFFNYWVHSTNNNCYRGMHNDPGMNTMYTVKIWIGAAALQQEAAEIVDAVGCLHQVYGWADNQNGGEGFWSDGSFVFHGRHAMTYSYGTGTYEQAGKMLSLLNGTPFDFSDPRRDNPVKWAWSVFEPTLYDGQSIRNLQGRSPGDGHGSGKSVVGSMLDLLDFASIQDAERIKSFVKYTVQTDKVSAWTSGFTISQLVKLNQILNDDSVKPREDYYISKVYHNMDKVIHQRNTWAFAISMSSTRIHDYECINGNNLTGWYTGDGMTQLFVKNDQKQFAQYWQRIDPYKYPGVTLDTQERVAQTIITGKAFYKDFDFVGGVTLDDEYSVAAQKLNTWHLDEDMPQSGKYTSEPIKAHHSDMVAQKSWFMFDDEVVCLGGGINSTDDVDVRTIVENRQSSNVKSILPESSQTTERLAVVGVEASQTPQEENTPENTLDENLATKWAALDEGHITYDLGETQTVGMAGFAFMSGNIRTQQITIATSEDGEEWTTQFDGNSGGKTEGIEIFDLHNTDARYVRLYTHGNSAGTGWLSLTETQLYGAYEGEPKIVEAVNIGAEAITLDGEKVAFTDDVEKTYDNPKWVHEENVGGFYFPQDSNMTMRKTTGTGSFFEMWLNHGKNPVNEGYAYVIMPTMTAEQTKEYAQNPGVEILNNDEKISAVHDKSTGITGIVFWEAGTFDGFTVDAPMTLIYKETDSGIALAVSDPTHKLKDGHKIQTSRTLSPVELDWRMSMDTEEAGTINIDFSGSRGASVSATLLKGK